MATRALFEQSWYLVCDATHQIGFSPCGFLQDDMIMFPYVKHKPPCQAQFLPQGHNLNKLDSGLLVDDTY